jgi:ribosome-associated heat shock protein Hsp15
MEELEKLRIDKYLWSIRVFKTRSLAGKACTDGKVKMNGESVKASKIVKIGEIYFTKTEHKDWIIEVVELLSHRVNAATAIKYYVDKSPIPEKVDRTIASSFIFHTGKRQSKIGRPTKKSRRSLDGFFDED